MSRQFVEAVPSVSGPSCSYATLSNYNHGMAMAQPRVGDHSGFYVVPQYGGPGYGTLTHGSAPSCSGYFDINNAYMSNGGNCNQQYVRKLCQ